MTYVLESLPPKCGDCYGLVSKTSEKHVVVEVKPTPMEVYANERETIQKVLRCVADHLLQADRACISDRLEKEFGIEIGDMEW